MIPLSLPALPLTRIISNSTHIPTPGHGSWPGTLQDTSARGVFCPEQGGAEWSSLVADAGVAVTSRSMALVSDGLSSNPASPLLSCDFGQDLELFQPSSLCCKREAQDLYHQGLAQTQWDTRAQRQARGDCRTRVSTVFVKVSRRGPTASPSDGQQEEPGVSPARPSLGLGTQGPLWLFWEERSRAPLITPTGLSADTPCDPGPPGIRRTSLTAAPSSVTHLHG